MIKCNFKQIMFTVILSIVAVFAYTNVSEAICIHTYTAATCTKPKTCTKCKATLGSALGHNYEVCGNTAKCTKCGNTKIVDNVEEPEDEEPNVHVHTYSAATCISAKKCTICGYTMGSALGHNYVEKSKTDATCTTDGEIVNACTRCGNTQTTTIESKGHNYITTTNTTATCTTSGKLVKKCSICGDTKTNTTAALGHDYKTTTVAATCVANGKVTKKCSICGDTKVTTIAATGHKYDITSTTATCTVPGKIVEKCSVCGYTKTTTNQALGHKYVETSRTEATCTQTGKILKTCARCGDKQEVVIPALGHKTSIVYNTSYHWYECDVCNIETTNKEAHDFNSDDVCKVCGYRENGDVDDPDDSEDHDGSLIVEPWMKENDDLDCLAVSLRSEPYEEDRANKNIYALDEKVIYYVDYKNGGKDTDKTVTLQLTLPLSFKVVDSDGAKVSTSNKTFTWTFNGMENDESGTKVVIVRYKSLGSSLATFKTVKPKATISLAKAEKDVSAVLNMVVKDFDTEIKDEHDPYMYGDRDTKKFRPNDTITRGEGALVLTRIFGISTIYDNNTYAFPDLNETYLEARKAVIAATEYGLIQGYPDGTYKPNKPMTRGEFITILARQIEEEYGDGFEIKDSESLIKLYKDKTKIYYISDNEYYDAHWSAEYATLLARLNMTSVSESKTNLRLDQPITRAEVAQLVNFYLMRAPANVTSSTKVQFPDVSKRHELFADIVEATRESHRYSITEEGTEEEE